MTRATNIVMMLLLLVPVSCGKDSSTESEPPIDSEDLEDDQTVLNPDSPPVNNPPNSGKNNGPGDHKQDEDPLQQDTCIPSPGQTPESIADVVALVNSLQRPVTIPCVLRSLKQPLRINATKSALSVQPAVGEQNPRFFINYGNLLISVVPYGDGSKHMELSELVGDTRSIKGDLLFPVTDEQLADDAFFVEILRDDNAGTSCAGCHPQEQPAPEHYGYGPKAFVSKAFKPPVRHDVSLIDLSIWTASCIDASHRCRILRALFDGTDVEPYEFPAAMDGMF